MMRSTVGDVAPAARALKTPPITVEVLTEAEFAAAIAERERTPRDDAALTDACRQALRSTGERLPRIPLRVMRGWSPNGTLPKNWGVGVECGEVPVVFAMLPAPFIGYVSVVARADDLPNAVFDEEQLASALADALLKEIPE
ncbi:MAG: hypothetical protein ACLP1X_12915 [Polyangiaceae bacterium]|jgi:hypothetical protein